MRFSKEDLFDAMFHDEMTKTSIRYEMRDLVEKHPDMVEVLAEAKDDNNQYLFQAKDINWILFKCHKEIENNPEKLKTVLNDPEKISLISGSPIRHEGFVRALHNFPDVTRSFNEKIGFFSKNGIER